MRELLEQKLVELKQKTFSELVKLPESEGERVKHRSRNVTVTVWKDAVAANSVRVVVQVYQHFILGVGRMDAAGFCMDDQGLITDVDPDDLDEFR